jgi:hypothetical protein
MHTQFKLATDRWEWMWLTLCKLRRGRALAEFDRPESGGRPGDGFLALWDPDLPNRKEPSSGGVLSSLLCVDPNLFFDPCLDIVGREDALLPSPPAILRVSFGFLCARMSLCCVSFVV